MAWTASKRVWERGESQSVCARMVTQEEIRFREQRTTSGRNESPEGDVEAVTSSPSLPPPLTSLNDVPSCATVAGEGRAARAAVSPSSGVAENRGGYVSPHDSDSVECRSESFECS